ncbi:hypothetical protein [Staphylococcus caeli]|uniref:Lipoprotein n=1 Tax=Staphylococcus caeli TaxID=2201815 RepID=A0A1D4NEZ4_9STAP|nr:hypothetical protein [Staphylococcus caeli]AWM30222.1 hypothetical protein SCC82B_00082 [Staphylococcus caeli]SCT09282.1 Uncharacterised protein [Staphylococcus caeli]SCT13760.1 Uncharacterised protein [Staphylococcus caeli]
MKKILLGILTASAILTLSACSDEKDKSDTSNKSEDKTENSSNNTDDTAKREEQEKKDNPEYTVSDEEEKEVEKYIYGEKDTPIYNALYTGTGTFQRENDDDYREIINLSGSDIVYYGENGEGADLQYHIKKITDDEIIAVRSKVMLEIGGLEGKKDSKLVIKLIEDIDNEHKKISIKEDDKPEFIAVMEPSDDY